MTKKKPSLTSQLLNRMWTLFLNGLFTILPLALTIWLFRISFKFIIDSLSPLKPYVPQLLQKVPYAELIVVVFSLFIIGTLMRNFILRKLIHSIENLIFKLPLIRPIYSGIKQLVQAFSIQDKITFKKVVLVEFPRRGIYSLGFLTSELPKTIGPNQEERFFNIFIPTTPNPTSGYFIIAPESNILSIDLSRQEAMAMIISGGIIKPERFSD